MKILKKENLDKAIKVLKEGKVLVFPTETSYGLGCDAANQDAVDRIFKIKERKSDNPLLVIVPTVEAAKKYLVWNELLEKLASKFWPASAPAGLRRGKPVFTSLRRDKPGPLTVVGQYLSSRGVPTSRDDEAIPLAGGVVSKENTLALRVSAHPVPKFLSEKLGRPVVATSANIADAGDIYDSKKIIEIFADKKFQPDALVDAGELSRNPPSTVVSVLNNELKILRQGELKIV